MKNPPPLNILELQFRSREEFISYWRGYSNLGTSIWLWHETLGDRPGHVEWAGICDNCQTNTVFRVPTTSQEDDRFKHRASWPALGCLKCKLDSRDRYVLKHLSDTAEQADTIYHVGHYSPLSVALLKKTPSLFRSQYKDGIESGHIDENGVRYEDLTKLSFAADSINHIVCSEILEHIPDYVLSMREMLRILTANGQAILTFPWLGGEFYDHLIRAEVLADGSIKHHMPPEYHGDPASKEGILSFRAFGWKILDELREVGFRDVYAKYIFGPLHGYMTLIHPIIVAVK